MKNIIDETEEIMKTIIDETEEIQKSSVKTIQNNWLKYLPITRRRKIYDGIWKNYVEYRYTNKFFNKNPTENQIKNLKKKTNGEKTEST